MIHSTVINSNSLGTGLSIGGDQPVISTLAEDEVEPLVHIWVDGMGAELLLVSDAFWFSVLAGEGSIRVNGGDVFGFEVHDGAYFLEHFRKDRFT